MRGEMGALDQVDLTPTLKRSAQDERLAIAGRRLAQLRLALGGKLDGHPELGPPLTVVMEGWDASGKGGAIKRLVVPLDVRHVRVATYSAPSPDELRHHYLHRFVGALPGTGGMTIYDRSWYGRVLVERVEQLTPEEDWRRAYGEIVNFERMLDASGMIIVKIWLHISQEEQLERFKRREEDPLKRWKITDEDWRNRDKHDAYVAAVEDMLSLTDIAEAPWQVISGESKRYARVAVMETVIQQIELGCATRGFPLPDPIEV
jgi:AMP-polyphosphate phosphotransferase